MADVLDVGVSNEDVLDVQARLMFLQLYHGHCDGEYSSTVAEAVIAFQHHVGADPTGTLDEPGLQYLREYSDSHGYGHQHQQHHESHGHQHGHEHMGADEWAIAQARLEGAPTIAVEADPGDSVTVHLHGDGHGHRHVQGNFYRDLRQTLHIASTRALLHATANDEAVRTACSAFKSQYAAAKLKELEHKVTLEDLGKQITRSLMDVVGIRVCKDIGEAAGETVKWFAEQISTGMARKMAATTHNVLAVDHTEKSLVNGFEAMMSRAEVHASVCHDAADETIRHALRPVYTAIDQEGPLDTAETAWVAAFFDTNDDGIDDLIEQVFAIPGPTRRKEVEVQVYEQLVADFTELYIIQTENSSIFPTRRDAHEEYEYDPAKRAHKAAAEAAAAFGEQVGAHPQE